MSSNTKMILFIMVIVNVVLGSATELELTREVPDETFHVTSVDHELTKEQSERFVILDIKTFVAKINGVREKLTLIADYFYHDFYRYELRCAVKDLVKNYLSLVKESSNALKIFEDDSKRALDGLYFILNELKHGTIKEALHTLALSSGIVAKATLNLASEFETHTRNMEELSNKALLIANTEETNQSQEEKILTRLIQELEEKQKGLDAKIETINAQIRSKRKEVAQEEKKKRDLTIASYFFFFMPVVSLGLLGGSLATAKAAEKQEEEMLRLMQKREELVNVQLDAVNSKLKNSKKEGKSLKALFHSLESVVKTNGYVKTVFSNMKSMWQEILDESQEIKETVKDSTVELNQEINIDWVTRIGIKWRIMKNRYHDAHNILVRGQFSNAYALRNWLKQMEEWEKEAGSDECE